MKQRTKLLCLCIALSTSAAVVQITFAETNPEVQATPSTAPVAFVYVSSTPSGANNVVNAFTAAANGKLTAVPGSPFHDNVTSMVVNGKYLFGSNKAGIYVPAFAIQPNGSLKWTVSTDVDRASGCPNPAALILDHTGANVYRASTTGGLCDHTTYQSFSIEKPTGRLTFLGSGTSTFLFNTPLTFIANNAFAYGSDCVNFQGNFTDTFTTLHRQSNGLLLNVNASAPTPKTQNPGDFYCRSITAADPTNHLAVSLQAIDPSTSSAVGSPQLATYTADGTSGNLTTTSTFANMPSTDVQFVLNMAMSPSGKLLAVAGTGGLQIFHYNGASPITHDTGLLTSNQIDQMFWDNANHLYAISSTAGKLYVFTITSTSATQATGSPYTISHPQNIIVQPR
jgi:hypothetical protein